MDSLIWKSTWDKPKNFKTVKGGKNPIYSYDIPVYTYRQNLIDTLNINVPHRIDPESGRIWINEDSINEYIKNIIKVGVSESAVVCFKRDGETFPFVQYIEIYKHEVEKYHENKILINRFNKIKKLKEINDNKRKHKIR